MFEQIVNPRTLTKLSPAEKRKARVRSGLGTLLLGLALLVQLAHDYTSAPAFHHVRAIVAVLMAVGLAFEFWGLIVGHFDWSTTVRKY